MASLPTVISGPSGRVVSAANLRAHARIDDTSEDTLLEELLDSAENAAEFFLWRKLLTQTWDHYFDEFSDPLVLRWPASSISSITYTDANGDSQTLSTDVYELAECDGVSVVRRKYNQDWPSVRDHYDVVTVRAVHGYGAASDVPPDIVQAIKLHANWNFRYRGDEGIGPMMNAFQARLRPYRLARWQKTGGM